jgi:plastocyanin
MKSVRFLSILGAAAIAAGFFAVMPQQAFGEDSYVLTIKDHKFEPAELTVPAGAEIKLVVKNLDATPEEFESETLDVEKVIPGGQDAEFMVGPLEAGEYEFIGEFNPATAKGKILAN